MSEQQDFSFRIDDQATGAVALRICDLVRVAGGRALFVGGCVRDAALGRPAKDVDIEVYGLAPDAVQRILAAEFPVDLVGQSFGVLKVHGLPVDVALPRRESKRGLGHKAFEVHSDPFMSQVEAASRRDFTINAMAWDPLDGTLVDPFHGMADLRAGVLRHTSDKFSEDPLRVLRGMQFMARFRLAVAPETVALCRAIGLEDLAAERIFEEWRKLILLGVQPSLGLAFLTDCGWIDHFPELAALWGCPQDPEWHPEGDVWTHTLKSLDAFARHRVGDDWEDLVVGFAVLCHDMGKPATTVAEGDHIRSRGHEAAGEVPARAFLDRMTQHQDLVEAVIPLVVTHMRPQELFDSQAGDSAIRRLARKVGRIDRLVRVDCADRRGRLADADDPEATTPGAWLMQRAHALAVADAAPRPLVMGRHLIAMGLKPGPRFGDWLEEAYEAQLEGLFFTLEDGLEFVRAKLLPPQADGA